MLLRPSTGPTILLSTLRAAAFLLTVRYHSTKAGLIILLIFEKGTDQGLLNSYFKNWDHILFIYNCTHSGHYQWVSSAAWLRRAVANMLLIDKPSRSHTTGRISHWPISSEPRNRGISTGPDPGPQIRRAPDNQLRRLWWGVWDKRVGELTPLATAAASARAAPAAARAAAARAAAAIRSRAIARRQ